MEYARDRHGKLVHHSVAVRSEYYECPHCFERVFVRRGSKACFFHERIPDRTPLQRTCPEYHENDSYRKIEDELNIIFINNGGIPLYLCNFGSHFELRAYFPKLSERSYENLKKIGAKIHVSPKYGLEVDKKTYSIENLDYYPVNTIDKWIDVTCTPPISDREVQRKWLWGIRGVDLEKDIYYSNREGGYRVALKANIRIGRSYRIMFEKTPPKIEGIKFHKAGQICLRKGYINKEINVYEMLIEKYTEQAREFIESKGYRLVDRSSYLLPLWPPAAFKGNEITFDQKEALFLHIDNSGKEEIYYTLHEHLIRAYHSATKNNAIIPLKIKNGSSIIISHREEITDYEIKYSTFYSPSLVQKQELKPEIIIEDSNRVKVNLDEAHTKLPKNRTLYINSNVPFCATVNSGNYVISSSSTCFENVGYQRKLILDCKAFGVKKYIYKNKDSKEKVLNKINWEAEYLKLYRCSSPTIRADNRYKKLLYLLSQNINRNNIQLYRLLETWIKTNSIPVAAIRYMDELLEGLGGVANE